LRVEATGAILVAGGGDDPPLPRRGWGSAVDAVYAEVRTRPFKHMKLVGVLLMASWLFTGLVPPAVRGVDAAGVPDPPRRIFILYWRPVRFAFLRAVHRRLRSEHAREASAGRDRLAQETGPMNCPVCGQENQETDLTSNMCLAPLKARQPSAKANGGSATARLIAWRKRT
jgi:hypothetical protein